MKRLTIVLLCLLFSSPVWPDDNSFRTELENEIDFINSRLSHSQVARINDSGTVRIVTPRRIVEFPIQDVSFNYNASDHRVRVAGNYNIKRFRHGRLTDVTHRNSFSSPSRRTALEAIDAFRRIQDHFTHDDPRQQWMNTVLPIPERRPEYRTIGEAITYINDNLAYSVILGLDENGIMTVNAPSRMYRVNIIEAEFSSYDWSGDGKVRVYGDWCIRVSDDDRGRYDRYVPRVEFNVHSFTRVKPSVRALYYIKGALLDRTAAEIEEFLDWKMTQQRDYESIGEAIKYINDRLEISIITDIDSDGVMTINASRSIYKVPVRDSRFRRGSREQITFLGFEVATGHGITVEISSPEGIEQYRDRRFERRLDSQEFSVRSRHDIREIIEALEYIKFMIR